MARPNFGDSAQRIAYRPELRRFARRWRLLGIALILGGVGVVVVRGEGFDPLSLALVSAGWVVFIGVIVARSRHHRSRMAEDDGAATS